MTNPCGALRLRAMRSRMSRVSCDVVVIGTELCGLTAAALVAHKGNRRVVVIEDNDPQDALPLGDRLAPTAPTLLRLSHVGPPAQVVETLGLKQDARRVLGDALALGVIDDPDVRMLLHPDTDKRRRELARVFGDAAEAIAKTLAIPMAEERAGVLEECALLHEDGFFEKRRARKRIELLGMQARFDEEHAAMRALTATPLGVVATQLVPHVQARQGASALGLAGELAMLQLQAGVHVAAKGGLGARAALRDELLRQITGHGGDVLKGRLDGIDVDGKFLTTIRATGANEYVAKAVIDATSRRDLAARLPESRRREKLIESEKLVQPAGEVAVARWLVPIAALPRPLPPMSIVLREEPDAGAVIGVYAGAPLKEGHKGGGLDETCVAVVCGAPCANGEGERAAAKLDALLEHLLPFAKPTLRARDIVIGPAAHAAMPRYVTINGGEHLLGGRRPRTPFGNLARAGRDLVPGFGVDAEVVAARSVATVIEEILASKRAQRAA
jgi:hypothetical protein